MNTESKMNQISGEAENILGALKGAIDHTATQVASASGDHKEVVKELSHIINAASYLKSNWKKAVPAIAAMGASAYLLTLRNKAAKTAKSAKKAVASAPRSAGAAKKVAKKVVKSAKKKVAKAVKKAKRK